MVHCLCLNDTKLISPFLVKMIKMCIHVYIYMYLYIYIYAHTHPHDLPYIYERRAKTHERFYMIEVHRHRFARHARKVSFEKCEHWRKVCERSAKDQIVSTL